MGIHYCEIPDSGYFTCIKHVVRTAFSWLLMFQCWITIAYFCMVFVWALLAVVLNPQEYLVYGVAVTVGCVIVGVCYKELGSVAKTFRKVAAESLNYHMSKAFSQAAHSQAEIR